MQDNIDKDDDNYSDSRIFDSNHSNINSSNNEDCDNESEPANADESEDGPIPAKEVLEEETDRMETDANGDIEK